nr:MAG TPA: hypothetical protein [Caudoviricetes sp.]
MLSVSLFDGCQPFLFHHCVLRCWLTSKTSMSSRYLRISVIIIA